MTVRNLDCQKYRVVRYSDLEVSTSGIFLLSRTNEKREKVWCQRSSSSGVCDTKFWPPPHGYCTAASRNLAERIPVTPTMLRYNSREEGGRIWPNYDSQRYTHKRHNCGFSSKSSPSHKRRGVRPEIAFTDVILCLTDFVTHLMTFRSKKPQKPLSAKSQSQESTGISACGIRLPRFEAELDCIF